MNNSTEV